MKAIEWHRYLESQRQLHGKEVFTVTELANVSGTAPHALNVEIGRLLKRGVIARYARGRYGLPDAVTPEALLPMVDLGAYITGFYALYRHNMVTQRPVEVTCFTNRRHNRSRVRTSAAGRLIFVCVSPPVYSAPLDLPIAPPEQALCDFVFLLRRQGLEAMGLVTFRGLDRIDRLELARVGERYPATVRESVTRIITRSGVEAATYAHGGVPS